MELRHVNNRTLEISILSLNEEALKKRENREKKTQKHCEIGIKSIWQYIDRVWVIDRATWLT